MIVKSSGRAKSPLIDRFGLVGTEEQASPLFGLAPADYDSLFEDKLDLMLRLRDDPQPHWRDRHRAPLTGRGVYPGPAQERLPMWIENGGTPSSAVRTGLPGLPLMVGIIGGDPRQFRPLIDLYRAPGQKSGGDAVDAVTAEELFELVTTTLSWGVDRFGDDEQAARRRTTLATAGVFA